MWSGVEWCSVVWRGVEWGSVGWCGVVGCDVQWCGRLKGKSLLVSYDNCHGNRTRHTFSNKHW